MNFIYEKFKEKVSFDSSKMDELIQLGRDLDEDVVSQLLLVHFETSEATLKEIETEFTNLEFQKIKSSVHKLKSSCGTLGLAKLHSLCHALENYLKEKDSCAAIVRNYLDSIHFEYAETKKIISDFKTQKLGA